MDIVVIIMGIIAVGAGIAIEHSGKDSGGDTLDDVK